MDLKGKRCVLYTRVSTMIQVEGYSLDAQKNRLREFANNNDMIIVKEFCDEGKSGKSITGRPEFQNMLKLIEEEQEHIDYVLVYKLSRFGRSCIDILKSLEILEEYNVYLKCLDDPIDTSDSMGKLLVMLLSSMAEVERENILAQSMSGRNQKAKEGGWNGGIAPYGYRLENKHLYIEEIEAEAIRMIYDKYLSSELIGYTGVAKYLNDKGIKKIVRGNGKFEMWSALMVKRILDNPVYYGNIAYGRRGRKDVKERDDTGKMVKATHQYWTDNYINAEGKHEGIVLKEIWDLAHEKRERTGIRPKAKTESGKDTIHLLSGLLKCPICGMPMYTNPSRYKRKDGSVYNAIYYVCSSIRIRRGRTCSYKSSLRDEKIENEVISAIKKMVDNEQFANKIKEKIGTQIDTTEIDQMIQIQDKVVHAAENSIKRIGEEIDKLPEETRNYLRRKNDLQERLEKQYDIKYNAEDKVVDLKKRKKGVEMQAISIDNIYKILKNFGTLFDKLNAKEQRQALVILVKEIDIYPKEQVTDGKNLKSILFNFPVFYDGQEGNKYLRDKETHVETVALLAKESIIQ